MAVATAAGTAMIEVVDVRKRYGTIQAVDGVSFSVSRGEVFGLLGPNGAGKTTAISMMVGAIRPDSGTVRIGGSGDPAKPATRKAVGIAPQALALYDELTGEENLGFYGRLYGLCGLKQKERIDWALNLSGLSDRRKHAVRTYSGGMKRRLNIACALVHAPEVVYLDEPTVGVDPQSRNHIFDAVERLKAEGLTVIYTTHYMEEAQRLCDRVGIMDQGKLLALDTVDELIEQHGGASVIYAEFEKPPAESPIPGATLDGATLRADSKQPFQDVARLAQSGLALTTLRVDRPNLESVFLSLTGRSLRD